MNPLRFAITFHEPFAISTGTPDEGLDVTVDMDNAFPGSVVKGLLRGHAEHWLGISSPELDRIFGSGAKGCQWVFEDAKLTRATRSIWNRIEVDDDGRSEDGSIVTGQQVWATGGTFECEWLGAGDPPAADVLVLRAAARDIVSVGSNRRRGFGWVSVEDDAEWTAADTDNLRKLMEATS